MRTSKWLLITLAASVIAGGLTLATVKAQDARRPSAMRGQFLARAKERLGLTDDQLVKIKAELKSEKDTLTGLITKLHDERVALRGVIQKPGSSDADIRAASAKVAAVEADLAVERAKLYGKISPILTADQLEKIAEFQDRADDFVDGAIKTVGERLAE
jgi:Spy/CpxP family protein refolding chaperone